MVVLWQCVCVWVWGVAAGGNGFLMGVVAGGVCCGEDGFWLLLFGNREIHRERERGRDEIDNKKELKK